MTPIKLPSMTRKKRRWKTSVGRTRTSALIFPTVTTQKPVVKKSELELLEYLGHINFIMPTRKAI